MVYLIQPSHKAKKDKLLASRLTDGLVYLKINNVNNKTATKRVINSN